MRKKVSKDYINDVENFDKLPVNQWERRAERMAQEQAAGKEVTEHVER